MQDKQPLLTDLDLLHLDEAYVLLTKAFDLAVQGRFPVGMQAIEQHMSVKGALTLVGNALREAYEEKIQALQKKPEEPCKDCGPDKE